MSDIFFKRNDDDDATARTIRQADVAVRTSRQRAAGQPYAGAVTPQEAFALVRSDPKVKIVDVRTNAERDWVGRVAIPEWLRDQDCAVPTTR